MVLTSICVLHERYEALAQIVLADVLLTAAGASRREEIESALLAAAPLIEETGASLYEPHLARVRERAKAELKP